MNGHGFPPVLLLAAERHKHEVFRLAQTLRAAGINIIEEPTKLVQNKMLTWAVTEARRRGIPRVVLYEGKKGSVESVLLLDCPHSPLRPRQTRVALKELPERLRAE